MSNKPILWIVVPCYNEQEVLPVTAPIFLDKINSLISSGRVNEESRILFVNDGSSDNTWKFITEISRQNKHFIGISQSRNRGHQNAVMAGLMEAMDKCDITISIDCDGQDDINAIDEMVEEYLKGSEIVYGVRSERKTDSFFKRVTAQGFYKLLRWLGADVVYNHADYRLVSNRALQQLKKYKEVNLFLRGIFPLIGFKSSTVYYERIGRLAGRTHYPLRKMLALAFDGIASLSVKPITLIITIGVIISVLGLVLLLIGLLLTARELYLILGAILLIGGIQLSAIGIVGFYIGKAYMETKARPRFIISERTENFNE